MRLQGVYPSTQFARALEELGIRIIYAYSPQAKVRLRGSSGYSSTGFPRRADAPVWGSPCSELRLHNISTKEEANRYLLESESIGKEEFIPKHNRMFSRSAKEPDSAYRPSPKGLKLKDVFCLKEERTVSGDNTISYKGKVSQILPNEYRISFVKAKVKVHVGRPVGEHLDDSILDRASAHIFYQGKKLKHKQIPKGKTKPKEDELITMNY